jgi:Uncharacterised protein family (UPF0158)
MIDLIIKRDDLVEALSTNLDSLDGGWFLDTESGAILLASDAIDDLPEDLEDNPRYLSIDLISSHESFTIMEDFVTGLGDSKEALRLAEALARPKPFRQFKDTLCTYPELREAWFAYEQAAYARLAEEWCDENGIKVAWA